MHAYLLMNLPNNRVGLFPSVSAEHLQSNGLNAKEWVEYCIAGVGLGGKGGGKAVCIYTCMYVCMYVCIMCS